jgi:flagellar protein FlgJ
MISPTDNNAASLAIDANGLSGLRLAAKENSPDAAKGVAKQFEALFLNMMMKSMREATPQDGPMDSEQSKMFTTMLDQQMTQKMADKGIGLADALVRQLTKYEVGTGLSSPDDKSNPLSPAAVQHTGKHAAASKGQSAHVKAFQDLLGPHANEASQATGVPAKFMLGQAALESGWGKREIKMADGSCSYNVFGMKATSGWKGKVVVAPTTEYVNGVPRTMLQKFRAYDSYSAAFHDYAKTLRSNPRYGAVLANSHDATSFAQGLQKAGYATDPHYAAKLKNIINKSLV